MKGNGTMYYAKMIYDEIGNELKNPTDRDIRLLAKNFCMGAWPDSPARRVREIKIFKDLKILFSENQ